MITEKQLFEFKQKYSRYVAMFYVFAFLVAGYYLGEMLQFVFQKARINDIEILGDQFTLSTLVAMGISAAVAAVIYFNRKIHSASYNTANELFEVDWPDKDSTKESSIITISFSIVLAVILAIMDLIWSSLTTFLFT